MALRAQCSSCGKVYKVGDQLAGRRAKCAGCGEVMMLPTSAEPGPVRATRRPATNAAAKPAAKAASRVAAAPPVSVAVESGGGGYDLAAPPMVPRPEASPPGAVAALNPAQAKLAAALQGTKASETRPGMLGKLTWKTCVVALPFAVASLMTILWSISERAYEVVVFGPLVVGALMYIVGHLWFLGVAFSVSVGYTLCTFIPFPPLQLFATFKILQENPDEAGPPFITGFFGGLTAVAAFAPMAIKAMMEM